MMLNVALLGQSLPSRALPGVPGSSRCVALGLGVYVFAVLFPAVFAAFVAGRIAIGR